MGRRVNMAVVVQAIRLGYTSMPTTAFMMLVFMRLRMDKLDISTEMWL
jgi:hypothetical protein